MQNFTDEQIQRFTHSWYYAVETKATGGTAEEVSQRAKAEAEDLLNRLEKAPALADLTVNPLLLTMIANVHKYRGALPGSRSELYGEICQVMLWRRQEAKNLNTAMDGDKKQAVLRELAYTMMEQRTPDLRKADVLNVISNGLRRISRSITADEFLADISSNGLMIEREYGQYAFAHHTFQEFLAAQHIHEAGLVQTLVDNVNVAWWRETTLLFAARSNVDPIVRACLADNSVAALSLAFDCAEQGTYLAPDLHERLNMLFAEALRDNADVNRRSLAAHVLTTRRLQETIRTKGGARVCPNPITRKIYYLFRQDVPGPLPDGPATFYPDDKPVTGIWPSDLTDFIKWVNSTTGTEKKYRRPSWAELNEPSVRRALANSAHSVWVTDDAAHHTVWTPSRNHPHMVDQDLLIGQIDDDIRVLIDIRISTSNRRLPAFTRTKAGRCLEELVVVKDRPDMAEPAARYGFAMHTAVQAAAEAAGQFDDYLYTTFVLSFIGTANVEDTVDVVHFDDLAELVRQNQRDLSQSGAKNRPSTQQWVNIVAERLADTAVPILTRERPIDRATAAALRVAALCLAAEADRRYTTRSTVSAAYRMIAAGLVLLERRMTGEQPASEAIILATD